MRIYSLDYLRGLAALGIMIFHYSSWTFGKFPANTFLGRFGVYGVSTFYILSGLTLFHVYQNKLTLRFSSLYTFFKKRFLRIYPLFWLATIMTIVVLGQNPGRFKLALNFSGLFGFFKWNEGIATGSWSIGNELVFYVLFPFLIFFSRKSLLALMFVTVLAFALHVYFAFHLLPDLNSGFWRNYVNPLNQVFLFIGGFLIGFLFQHTLIKNSLNFILLSFALILFVFYPVTGQFSDLVTGNTRLVFTFLCFVICFGFYKFSFNIPSFLHHLLAFLGKCSYSLYLLHYIIFMLVGRGISAMQNRPLEPMGILGFCIAIAVTVLVSFLTYSYFEKPLMRLGTKEKQ
jgi:exopolysaccharide production protein ExoZ